MGWEFRLELHLEEGLYAAGEILRRRRISPSQAWGTEGSDASGSLMPRPAVPRKPADELRAGT